MTKPAAKAPAASVALYEALIATHPKAERKGATTPYTSVNGNMFSFLTPEGILGLRLSAGDRAAFVKRYKTEPLVQHGATMKEYVQVPATLLKKTATLAPYFDKSYRYASTLKSKPTTKRGAAAKSGSKPTRKAK
ncbi:MAG TPA: hypothetical protein VJL90_16220 [Pseudorhodoplanes sp.]|nr:hypothetical protein [Pseudorhodoplanes sp.]